MKRYQVTTFTTGCLSGTLNPLRLQAALDAEAAQGWRFVNTIKEQKRIFIFWHREAHFLIFERDAESPVA